MKKLILSLFIISTFMNISAQDITLPAPSKTGGKPLMEALSERKSQKDNYLNKDLDKQTLSDLLWSAYGFNRLGKRTVPSASNAQELSIYVLLTNGAYLYNAETNKLEFITESISKDLLAAQQQPYVNDVPVHLVYVGNKDKSKAGRDGILIDTGFVSQNVYLYCASKDLGTVARASFNRKGLPTALNLTDNQEIILVQAVGEISK